MGPSSSYDTKGRSTLIISIGDGKNQPNGKGLIYP